VRNLLSETGPRQRVQIRGEFGSVGREIISGMILAEPDRLMNDRSDVLARLAGRRDSEYTDALTRAGPPNGKRAMRNNHLVPWSKAHTRTVWGPSVRR